MWRGGERLASASGRRHSDTKTETAKFTDRQGARSQTANKTKKSKQARDYGRRSQHPSPPKPAQPIRRSGRAMTPRARRVGDGRARGRTLPPFPPPARRYRAARGPVAVRPQPVPSRPLSHCARAAGGDATRRGVERRDAKPLTPHHLGKGKIQTRYPKSPPPFASGGKAPSTLREGGSRRQAYPCTPNMAPPIAEQEDARRTTKHR